MATAGPTGKEGIDLKDLIIRAIREREVLRVRYLREDSVVTEREVEPFDLAPIRTGELAFWGWCRDHDRYEMRKFHRIIEASGTRKSFDPAPRMATFKSPPTFAVERDW
jgi:predicted DNA-binding transcriptional regulator YafY